MVFLVVVVFLSVRVCVCCARCNEDLFFKKRKVFVVFIPLFCLLFFVFALI